MPLCPQITNTPITVTQTADFTVTSVVPLVADTSDGLANNLESIEILADGKTKVYRQAAAPTGAGINDGDLWIDTDDGNKLYVRVSGAWVSAQDNAIATAQATADGKNKIFRTTTAPTATAIGDTWFDTDDGNKLYYWTGSAWVSVQDTAIATAQATADSKIKTFYQTSAPTATGVGDVWFDTDDGNKQYRWNGSSWVSVQDTAIAAATSAANAATTAAAAASSAAAAAQSAATAAQTTADGKNKVYRQTTQPTTGPFAEGDLWFDTDDDNKIYRYTSGSWGTAVSLGNNALGNLSANKITSGTIDASVITVSNINAGNISTGTLNADRIAAASITGAKIAAGTITAANITAGTITSAEIATGTITASDIATGTITASNIASGTITGSLIAAGTITATNIATNTITASQIAAGTITSTQIAAGTITASNIASGTITATQISSSYIYAGTIAASQIVAGTLTGFTIQTSSGATAVILDGTSNALQFKVSGSISGNVLPLGSAGILMHYGSTPDGTGATYPKAQVTSSSATIAGSTSQSMSAGAGGNTIVGQTQVTDAMTFSSTIFANGNIDGGVNCEIYAFRGATNTTTGNAANAWLNSTTGRLARSTSSLRYKTDVQPQSIPFDSILQLEPKSFYDKREYEENPETAKRILGLIAEEVAEIPVLKDLLVNYDAEGNADAISYPTIAVAILPLLKDFNARIQALEQGK
jgi:hypothetical protein